jgi:hypothetical protein
VNGAVHRLDQITQENSVSAEHAAAAVERLGARGNELVDIVDVLRRMVSNAAPKPTAGPVRAVERPAAKRAPIPV